MAGKRQHYIPRLLQRGFLADRTDEAERTWLHRHGTSAKLVGICDVGVEEWFYSRKSLDGTRTLDDAITDYERDLSKRVRALRETAPGTTIPPHHAAETVVHLVTRAAHLRNLLRTGMSQLLVEIEAQFINPVRLGSVIGLTSPGLGEPAREVIRDIAEKLVQAGIPSAFSERLMTFLFRELGDQLLPDLAAKFAPLISKMVGDIAALVRDGHNKLLARPIADNGWVAALTQFVWTIEGAEDLILSDAVALSRAAGGQLAPFLFTSGLEAEVVVMPLASDRILVGRRDNAAFDLGGFNEDAASASESFFVAARPHDDSVLIKKIGTGSAEALERIITDVIIEAEQSRQLVNFEMPPKQLEKQVEPNFNFSVRLADFGDSVLAEEIAGVIQAVVTQLALELPLHDLDGVTIAANYVEALATLDRGDSDMPPATSGALGYGRGIAKQVTVRRDGVRKEHLVIAAGIAETWISPVPDTRAFGLHILVKMLVGIAHSTCYASALGVGFKPDPMARELHLAVGGAPSAYWSARRAAFVAPNEGTTYADLVIEGLDCAEREIAAERAKMTDSGDVGPTTKRALEFVAAVLDHVANWLGHRDGLAEGEAFAGSDLPERLKSRGLDRWINVFGRDLAACYGPEGALQLSVLTTLSQHVERLFWSLGLYCWPEGDNVRCIVSDQRFLPPQLPSN